MRPVDAPETDDRIDGTVEISGDPRQQAVGLRAAQVDQSHDPVSGRRHRRDGLGAGNDRYRGGGALVPREHDRGDQLGGEDTGQQYVEPAPWGRNGQ
jgi:hypothetical protein